MEQRIALTKPGNMRHHYNKKQERQNLVPRRPGEKEGKEVKRIEPENGKKNTTQHTSVVDISKTFQTKYLKNSKNPVHRPTYRWKQTEKPSQWSPPTPPTQEPGAYPSIPVQDFRDGPIEEIAARYVRINRVIENEDVRNEKQEDNVRAAELNIEFHV